MEGCRAPLAGLLTPGGGDGGGGDGGETVGCAVGGTGGGEGARGVDGDAATGPSCAVSTQAAKTNAQDGNRRECTGRPSSTSGNRTDVATSWECVGRQLDCWVWKGVTRSVRRRADTKGSTASKPTLPTESTTCRPRAIATPRQRKPLLRAIVRDASGRGEQGGGGGSGACTFASSVRDSSRNSASGAGAAEAVQVAVAEDGVAVEEEEVVGKEVPVGMEATEAACITRLDAHTRVS